MKKKILFVIVAVAMMIPLLAVGVSADYSPETGWSVPDAVVDGGLSVLLRTVNGEEVRDIPVTLYGYVITPYWDTVDLSKLPLGVDILPSDYEWYYLTEDVYNEAVVFRAKGLRVSDTGVTYTYVWINDGIGWQESQLNSGYWAPVLSSYPPPVTSDGLQFFNSFEFFVTYYKDSSRSPLLTLIELMFDNFSRIIGGLAAGVTGAFTVLIWENPEATEKTLSTAAKFIFTIAGLSIGMTVFYMVLRLIRFGRQR